MAERRAVKKSRRFLPAALFCLEFVTRSLFEFFWASFSALAFVAFGEVFYFSLFNHSSHDDFAAA
jgi:formate/nitrite transporter FocA (FNT family)